MAVIKQVMKSQGIDTKKFNPKAIHATISSAKNELVSASEYVGLAQGYFQRTVAKVYPEYQKVLRKNEALDFDDLLFEAVKLFRKNPLVLDKYQNTFQYILIDEYQDTNKAQYVLTKLLAQKNRNIFVSN